MEQQDLLTRKTRTAHDLQDELDRLKTRIHQFIMRVGKPGMCKECHTRVYWVTHLSEKKAPYDPDGLNHFATCPKRNGDRK